MQKNFAADKQAAINCGKGLPQYVVVTSPIKNGDKRVLTFVAIISIPNLIAPQKVVNLPGSAGEIQGLVPATVPG